MGLKRGAALLAFEFDLVIRALDLTARAWPQLRRGAGLRDLFNGQLSDVDLWRQGGLETLSGQARHAHLQWSIAHRLAAVHGEASEDWVVTMAELFEVAAPCGSDRADSLENGRGSSVACGR